MHVELTKSSEIDRSLLNSAWSGRIGLGAPFTISGILFSASCRLHLFLSILFPLVLLIQDPGVELDPDGRAISIQCTLNVFLLL